MLGLVRHRQTKGSVTDTPHLHHRATSRLYPYRMPLVITRWRIVVPMKVPEVPVPPKSLIDLKDQEMIPITPDA
jgi:hypothetical protein